MSKINFCQSFPLVVNLSPLEQISISINAKSIRKVCYYPKLLFWANIHQALLSQFSLIVEFSIEKVKSRTKIVESSTVLGFFAENIYLKCNISLSLFCLTKSHYTSPKLVTTCVYSYTSLRLTKDLVLISIIRLIRRFSNAIRKPDFGLA